MKHYRIRKGLPAGQGPSARQEIAVDVMPTEVAFLGQDFPGLRPRFSVDVGGRVDAGQTVFTDRRHSEIVYVSPIAGVVVEAAYGPRRTLSVCRIRAEGDASVEDATPPEDTAPREVLLSRGYWPAFRARPYGHVPAPDVVPRAIVVNAVAAVPEAPDPTVVLDGQGAAFERGIGVLTGLTEGTVFIAQSAGAPLGPTGDRIAHARFTGTAAAGLSGTQIDRLCPVGAGSGDEIWSIGYQDVAAIGHLFLTGRYAPDRVVSVADADGGVPRLHRTTLGARLADLVEGAGRGLVSVRAGMRREALFLGHGHDCVGLAPLRSPSGPRRAVRHRALVEAIIPSRGVERALAVDLLTVPLMKALSLGDGDRAAALGCLGLIEEDVAALTQRCTSGTDYGAALRAVLDDLMAAAA